MTDKIVLKSGKTLRFVPDYYRNQSTCIKAAHKYSHELKFAPDCYKTQKKCNEAVDTSHS